MNAREAAFRVISDFRSGKGDLEKIIDKAFTTGFISSRDRRLAFEISYGVLRHQTYLDYIIDQFIDSRLKNEKKIRLAVQIALYQIIYLDKIPQFSAVSESVNLMKNDNFTKKYAGVVNGILRNFLKNQKKAMSIPETMERIERLSLEYSHPAWMIERWIEQYGSAKTRKLLKANNGRPGLYVRWNSSSGTSRNAFESDIAALTETSPQGMGFKKSYYRLRDSVIPSETESFQAGTCTVQSPSSGWPVAMLDVKPGDVVFDISSAPGGKTTHIAEQVGPEGVVIAGDSNPKRIPLVIENAVRMRLADRIIPVVTDGARSGVSKHFDKILLDAPCSGTGVIQRHPDSRWIRKEKDITRIVEIQRSLLDAAAKQLKKGGVLVYSTCSLEKDENWNQVEAFLERNPDFSLEDASQFVDKKYVSIDKCLQITPFDHNLDGMFAARLVKTK